MLTCIATFQAIPKLLAAFQREVEDLTVELREKYLAEADMSGGLFFSSAKIFSDVDPLLVDEGCRFRLQLADL